MRLSRVGMLKARGVTTPSVVPDGLAFTEAVENARGTIKRKGAAMPWRQVR